MKILKMSESDLDEVIQIEQKEFSDPWPKAAFIRDLENKDAELIVLKNDEDELIGYYDLWHMFENADLANIAIKKEYQGKKLGEYLLKDCIIRCINSEVEFLHLEVRVDNLKAYNLYKKLGFIEVRKRIGYYAGIDGIDMVKGLVGLSEKNISD